MQRGVDRNFFLDDFSANKKIFFPSFFSLRRARADPPRWGDLPREKSRVPMTFVLYLVAELSQF